MDKLQICNISENDGSFNKLKSSHRNSLTSNAPENMTHGPGNGSEISIMSKNSSKEGAKLFESFNRNLIKTIKVRRSDLLLILIYNCHLTL